jgi:oligoendopeptidase F
VLLVKHLLSKTTDKSQRAYLINHFLESFRGTVYRQTMFAEFELMTHEAVERGESLTPDVLCDMYYELNKKYYGDDIVVDKDIAMEWARIPHFYYNFYVYQYATGFSAAVALAEKILSEGAPAVENYKKFLSGGCSKSPIELLRIAGVDMASPEPVNAGLKLFDELLGEMEALVE